MRVRVSVVATVRNEARSIATLLDSLCRQTRAPDEVVIADGGSTDGTLAILKKYAGSLPLRVLTLPTANISQGRNAAIHAATGEVIACTDAGVRLEPGWLAELVAPFEVEEAEKAQLAQLREHVEIPQFPWSFAPVQVVRGFFQAEPHTVFEAALGATTLPDLEDIDPAHFLPSSRSVAFRKSAWEAAGRYPEWLDYGEDLVFDLRLQEVAGQEGWAFAPYAVAHFRPRPGLRAFFRQYYRYARGDGKADLWRARHAIRFSTYLLALPALLLLGARVSRVFHIILGLAAFAYLRAPYRRLRPHLARSGPVDRLWAIL
ncbi:MAG: glycosyltransferase, partial [Anaerolineae bacterium]|nr:glycosyltransferase [Anaerolineae bacterium]